MKFEPSKLPNASRRITDTRLRLDSQPQPHGVEKGEKALDFRIALLESIR